MNEICTGVLISP